jgi:Rrf2 family protein
MVLLAKSSTPLSLPEISDAEGLSVPYAAKLLRILRKSDLVTAERGRNGGYRLVRSPESIPLNDVLDALGERVFSAAHCNRYSGDNETCVHIVDCTVRTVWRGFDKFLRQFLGGITLAQLAAGEVDAARFELQRTHS